MVDDTAFLLSKVAGEHGSVLSAHPSSDFCSLWSLATLKQATCLFARITPPRLWPKTFARSAFLAQPHTYDLYPL